VKHNRQLTAFSVSALVVAMSLAACMGTESAPDSEPVGSDSVALSGTPSCSTICDCPPGSGWTMCSNGSCAGPGAIFSPPPPLALWCGATCQCPEGTGCQPGAPGVCVPGTMTASQNPVIIPAGQTTGTFTLTWSAPGHSQVDLWGEQNLQSPGRKLFLGSGPTSGTALEPMSVGEVATLWLYAHGDTTTPLATLHITGQH
jgi:hypothetical protein